MTESFEELLKPVKELSDLTLKNIQKIAALQIKAIEDNTQVSIKALKSATEISDIDTLKNYLNDQIAVAKNISDHAIEDAQEIAKISETYASNVKELVEKSVNV